MHHFTFTLLVGSGKVFLDECEKGLTDIRLDTFAEGRIEPDYLPSSVCMIGMMRGRRCG